MAGKFGHRMRADLFYKSQYGGRFKTLVDEGVKLAQERGHTIPPLDKWENDPTYMGTYYGHCTICGMSVRVSMEEDQLSLGLAMAPSTTCPGKPWL